MERDEPIRLLIGEARRRIRQAVSSRVRRYYLTTQQFWAFVAIYEHPGSSLERTRSRLATGLLYIAILSVRVGEFMSRFILFRTSSPLCKASLTAMRN
ncbi:MAG: hypothetical protein ACHQ9S_20135 [Candidatus Binatia bacterium]